MSFSPQSLKSRSPARADVPEATSSSRLDSSSGPSRFLNRTQRRLQRDLTNPSSPLGMDTDCSSVASASEASNLFVTAPDTIPPVMVPTTSLGDPRYIMRPPAKEYSDPTALMSHHRKDGIVLLPEQVYVRLLRREVKLVQKATAGAGEVRPLPANASASASSSEERTRDIKPGSLDERPQQLTCAALRRPLASEGKTKRRAVKSTSRGMALKGGVTPTSTHHDEEDGEKDHALSGQDEDEDDDACGTVGDEDDDDAEADDKATDYVNPFSPSASPKLRAAMEARATETKSLLDALDVLHATWHRESQHVFQSLYENGQLQQDCAREGVAAFAKELGTVEAVSTLPPLPSVRDQAQRLAADVAVRGTATRRAPSHDPSVGGPHTSAEAEDRGDGNPRAVRPGSAAYYAAPWTLLEPSTSDAVTSTLPVPNGGLPHTAQQVDRAMHMALIETKLKYLIDHEIGLAQEHLRCALQGDITEANDVAVDM